MYQGFLDLGCIRKKDLDFKSNLKLSVRLLIIAKNSLKN